MKLTLLVGVMLGWSGCALALPMKIHPRQAASPSNYPQFQNLDQVRLSANALECVPEG
jgi:hypothetical protein